MILQTDKTSLEIQTALLSGKQILLKYNNETIGKIIEEYIQPYQQQQYYIRYHININRATYSFQTIEDCLYSSKNTTYASIAEAKASTDPVYLYVDEQPDDPIITDDPIINDPGSSR